MDSAGLAANGTLYYIIHPEKIRKSPNYYLFYILKYIFNNADEIVFAMCFAFETIF